MLRALAGLTVGIVAGALFAPGLAEAIIDSSANADTIYYDDTGLILDEASDSDTTTVALQTATARTLVCPPGDICVINPGPNDPWYFFTSSAADARTDYGVNRARASAGENSIHQNGFTDGQNDAGASSYWEDTLTLLLPGGGVPSGPLEVVFRFDGSWVGNGSFLYQLALYDPSAPEPGEPGSSGLPRDFDGRYADIFNCVLTSPCATFSLDPRYQLVQVGDDLDPSGSFDETVTLSMPYVPGKSLVLYAQLEVQAGNGYMDSRVEAFSSGVLQEIRVPFGAQLVSAEGALGNYNVTVPEPRAALLSVACLATLLGLRRRQ